MAITDASDREIVEYLRFLIDHEGQCALEDCPVCSTLTNICELAESLLFSIKFYQSADPQRYVVCDPKHIPKEMSGPLTSVVPEPLTCFSLECGGVMGGESDWVRKVDDGCH